MVLGNSRIFGYQKDHGRLMIDETEAPMVRELFELYATGGYSMKQIETVFWEKGYRNHNGKRITHTTMSGMIANPKYKGYYAGNKVKVINLFTKKQKFLPPEKWVMFKDETGEIHANLLTGKLYCMHCGAPCYRRDSVDKTGKKNSKWVCSAKIKNGAESCPSFAIYEDELKPVLFEVFRETEADAEALIVHRNIQISRPGQRDTRPRLRRGSPRARIFLRQFALIGGRFARPYCALRLRIQLLIENDFLKQLTMAELSRKILNITNGFAKPIVGRTSARNICKGVVNENGEEQ